MLPSHRIQTRGDIEHKTKRFSTKSMRNSGDELYTNKGG